MSVRIIGLKELQKAVKRNPKKVLREARYFLTRGIAIYKQGIIRSPWRIGSNGGGVPVKTGNLRDTHVTKINGLTATIGPNINLNKYAKYIHFGTKYMNPRPWLDYVKKTKNNQIERQYRAMLVNITKDLAK